MATNYSDFYKQYIEEKQSATIDDQADSKGWFHCVCPMHPQTSDKKDAGIHEVSGVLHCFVEDKIWTPAEFLHDYMEYDYTEADEIVAFFQAEHSLMKQEGNFTKTFSGYKPKFEALHLKSLDLIREDLHVVKEYMRARGIYYRTLLKYNVGYLPKELNGWGRDCLVFPYFHAGRVVALRYRDIGGNKGAEPGSFMTLWNLDKLTEDTRIAVILEGESDCIRTAQALGDDYVCVSAPQAIFRGEWKREFRNVSQVIIIPQDDMPSKKMANDAKTHLDGIKVINLPWGPREYGKDTVDWLRYHSDQELLDLVQGSISRRIQTVMDGPTFLEESKKPREWMIEGLLSRGQICMMAGPAKSGKTFLVLNLVRSLLNGEPFVGMPMFQPYIDPDNLYNILLWEEEGPLEELRERYEKVLKDTNWIERVYTAHQLGLKLDEDKWIERLVKEIEQKKIDLLIIDPFARCYGVDDENSASQMGQVWSRIASIMNRFPRLSIIILHHFAKSGSIEEGGNSVRGSSRSRGEYDLAIFTGASKAPGTFKMGFEARSIPQPVDSAGNKVFTLQFNDGIMVEASQSTTPMFEIERPLGNRVLKSIMAEKGEWALSDAADYYNTTPRTICSWIDKTVDPQTGKPLMERTKPSKNNPVKIRWVGYSQEFESPEETS